jgi:hypothetical protein
LTSALVSALVLPCALVLWAAASWLKDTASKPVRTTGKSLRITILQVRKWEIPKRYVQRPCHLDYFGGSTG